MRWQYKVEVSNGVALIAQELNEHGEQGWDLVGFCVTAEGQYHYVFKRPRPE